MNIEQALIAYFDDGKDWQKGYRALIERYKEYYDWLIDNPAISDNLSTRENVETVMKEYNRRQSKLYKVLK